VGLNVRRRLSARKRARIAFLGAYPGRAMRIHDVTVVDDFTLVTICTDLNMRPWTRTWWQIPVADSDSCRELSYGEASRLIDIPLWR